MRTVFATLTIIFAFFLIASLPTATTPKILLIAADAAHRADNLPEGWVAIPMGSNKELSLYLRSVNKNAKIAVAIHGNERGLRIKGDKRWPWSSYMELVESLDLNLYQVSCLGSKDEGNWNGYIKEHRGVKFLTRPGYKLVYNLDNLDKLP